MEGSFTVPGALSLQLDLHCNHLDLLSACFYVFKRLQAQSFMHARGEQRVPKASQAKSYETKAHGRSLTFPEYSATRTSCVVTVHDNMYSSLQHISFIAGLHKPLQ